MKFVSSSHGTVALHVSADDVVPEHGIVGHDLIEFVATTYQFSIRPNLLPGIPLFAIPAFQFQSGVMVAGDDKWPILQLTIVPNGDIITAQTTEIADAVLDDFMTRLDNTLKYRFAAAKKRRSYQSNVVVQFERGIEEKIGAMAKIETILNGEIKRASMPFKIKRLAFGYGEVAPTLTIPLILDAVENSDFLIERRTGEPYEENRYFCSAPMRTADHLKLLELIEREVGG